MMYYNYSIHVVAKRNLVGLLRICNVALTNQIRSYCDSETKENVKTQSNKQRGITTGTALRFMRTKCCYIIIVLYALQKNSPKHNFRHFQLILVMQT